MRATRASTDLKARASTGGHGREQPARPGATRHDLARAGTTWRDPARPGATRPRANGWPGYSGASPRSSGSPIAPQAGTPFATQATCSKPARRKSEAPMLER